MYLFLNLSGGILVEFFLIKFLGKTKGEVINFPAIYSSFFQIYCKNVIYGSPSYIRGLKLFCQSKSLSI